MSDKQEPSSETHSFDAPPSSSQSNHDHHHSSPTAKHPIISSLNLGLTVLSFLSALTIVGTSAETIQVYNSTSLNDGHFLSLWPNDFDLRPSVALVVCGTIILVCSLISLVVMRIPFIQNHTLLSTPLSLFLPSTSLLASLISTSMFYAKNSSSNTYTLQSWSCQWEDIPMNGAKPDWSRLCKESKVAVYLSVIMIPIQVLILGVVVVGVVGKVGRWVMGGNGSGNERREKGSPALS